jgi:hypothetical protein
MEKYNHNNLATQAVEIETQGFELRAKSTNVFSNKRAGQNISGHIQLFKAGLRHHRT